MDAEQQVRLNFLDEADECCDRIESSLLGISESIAEPATLDLALRSSHSIKGGAAMMGYPPLSGAAHRLEDFLKILRLRYTTQLIPLNVESMLLQSVDRLRQISDFHRQSQEVEAAWINQNVTPLYDQLREHLGDLNDADENMLLAQEEEVDPALLLFEDGVESILDDFEKGIEDLSRLPETLASTAEEMLTFGYMANLEPFIQLCEFVQQQAQYASGAEVEALAQYALKAWRRSHALVLRGSFDKLPNTLEHWTALASDTDQQTAAPSKSLPNESLPDESLESFAPVLDESALNDLDFDDLDLNDLDLSALQSEFAQADTSLNEPLLEDPSTAIGAEQQQEPLPQPPVEAHRLDELDHLSPLDLDAEVDPLASLSFDPSELSDLQSAFGEAAPVLDGLTIKDEVVEDEIVEDAIVEDATVEDLNPEQSQSAERNGSMVQSSPVVKTSVKVSSTPSQVQPIAPRSGKTVRVSADQLYQFNTLFSKLVLERNTIKLRLEQLQDDSALMRRRLSQLSQSNTQLRKWYDHASIEGVLPTTQTSAPESETSVSQGAPITHRTQTRKGVNEKFDALEMDQYSDLHLISQDQIETVVQLQEVSTDIEIGLRDMARAVSDFNQTTQLLQRNVTRTQMAPFGDMVKRFPRVLRDLNLQCGKSVNLKIEGETTLIDRAVIETLGDALLHLLRNAFDHGIEDNEDRLKVGKPAEGQITLQAENLSTQTIITLTDDGAGINLDKIRDRLQKIGVEPQEIEKFTDSELMDVIFEPGFSTASQVTELSGRGVGMDLVRTNLKDIRGTVSVTSQVGVGTTFTLSVPFTQSIMRVMLLERSGLVFAVSVDTVREVLRLQPPNPSELTETIWNNQPIPVIMLEDYLTFRRPGQGFEMTGTPKINQPTLVIAGNRSVLGGLMLDRFWGEQEVTVRPISSSLTMPPGFISSLILGDGRVVPLIDPGQLIEWCSDQDPVASEVALSPQSTPQGLGGKNTILVVDDSINVRRYLALTLEKAGYQVEQAKDGQDAVDKLGAGLSVMAVICDIEMPRLDGYGFLEEIKGQPEHQDLPVMMLTSRSNEKHRKIAMNLGATDYFSKPYNEPLLLKRLSELKVV